jgi:hypothetical protein
MQDAISVSETPVPLTVTAAPTATAQNGTSLWQVADTLGFAGQIVAADGEMLPMAASADADTVSELATLDSAEYTPEDSRTTLKLKQPLANVYDSATVEILGNVVPANHGRTIANEVVGSGDSGKANQSFALKYPHLIYESDPDDANAITSTLSVRVLATSASSLYASVSGISNQAAGGVVWKEVPTLYTAGPRDQVFTTQTDGSGVTTLIFGDGVRGARLPTGQDNVVATYRVGVASDGGSIQSGQLTLMQRRPAGLRQVVSPLPATGAIPRESMQQARLQAPLATNTMQRIVSLDDYAAFVSGIRGVGKVDVRTYRSGSRHLVLVTVASSDGKPVASDSALGMSVIEAVQHYQAAHARVRLATFRPRRFKVAASIVIDAASAGDDPQQTIASALTDAFSFGKRSFGQGVSESEVTTVIQDCPGVISVVLTGLYPSEHTAAILPYIGARRASWDARTDTVHDAALLVIDDDINLHLIDG